MQTAPDWQKTLANANEHHRGCLQSTAALPFGTIVVILVIWSLVTIPLTVFGGIAGKNHRAEFAAPVRTNKYPREVPALPWYRSTVPQMVMAGPAPAHKPVCTLEEAARASMQAPMLSERAVMWAIACCTVRLVRLECVWEL